MGTTKTRKARLSHDLIVQTALAFIDENGIEQLNMRALAARLSVQPMALYHYYSSKDSLLNAVAGLIDDTRPVQRTGSWRTDLLQVVHSFKAPSTTAFLTLRTSHRAGGATR